MARYAEAHPADRPGDEATRVDARRLAVVFENYRKFGLAEPPTTSSRQRFDFDDPTGPLFESLSRAEARPGACWKPCYLPRMLKEIVISGSSWCCS